MCQDIAIVWTPTFDWCVIRCGFKNGHQKDKCLEGVILCAQNVHHLDIKFPFWFQMSIIITLILYAKVITAKKKTYLMCCDLISIANKYHSKLL